MKDFKVYQTSGMLNFLVSEATDVRKKEQTISGDIVAFTADAESPMKIVVNIDSTGRIGCNIGHAGKNLFGGTYNVRFNFASPIKQGTTITISTANGSSNARVNFGNTSDSRFYNGGINTLNSALNRKYRTITLSQDAMFVYFDVFDAGDYQIEFRSVPTPYESYNPSSTAISATFPDEVGTITDGTLTVDYDGSVTLETGGQTYTLTSVSPIETLIGDNNIWADAGPVSVTYPI